MKKFNKNIIVFIAAFVFVFLGLGREFKDNMKASFEQMIDEIKSGYVLGAIIDFRDRIDNNSSETLGYHDLLMDIDSAKNNLLNTKIIKKEDATIFKTESGSLISASNRMITDEEIDAVVSEIKKLYNASVENNSEFLYVAVSAKGYDSILPKNVVNFNKPNYDKFIQALNKNDIPTLNLTEELIKENLWNEETYFVTDHHWKPSVGFWATGKICETLNQRYQFEYNAEYNDLKNYDIKTYEDWFLGSYGKKTGRLFTYEGAENIDIITPKFETNLTSNQPFKDLIITGSFSDVVMDKKNIERKDFYNLNAYATYTGGDFECQIVKNNINPEGKKILVIRDSFACVVTPFLSLNVGEMHTLDMRYFANVSGGRINVYDYISEEKPDYVIILYSGVYNLENSEGRYDFG